MGFNCGIVGLPNVGKSTLFNALTATAVAEAANFPFCTIEPNIAPIAVPDEWLEGLQSISGEAAAAAAAASTSLSLTRLVSVTLTPTRWSRRTAWRACCPRPTCST